MSDENKLKTIDFYQHGDFLDCYGSDALIVCRILGLVRLTVSDRHATAKFPAGTSHTAIPTYRREQWFERLQAEGWSPRVIKE